MQTIKHPLQRASPSTERYITSYHVISTTERRIYVRAARLSDELPYMATAWYLKRQFAELKTASALRASITLVPRLPTLSPSDNSAMAATRGRFDMQSGQDVNCHFPVFVAAELQHKLGCDENHNKS